MEIPTKACHFSIKRLKREVNILLLSDLHYDVVKEKKTGKYGKLVNSELVAGTQQASDEWIPDIALVAGDLVNLNNDTGYENYADLVGKLTKAFPNLRHAFFTSPGNHDVTLKSDAMKYLVELNDGEPLPIPDPNLESDKEKERLKNIRNVLYKISKLELNEKVLKSLSNFEKEYFKVYLGENKKLVTDPDAILVDTQVTTAADGIETVYMKSLLGVTLVCHNSSFFCKVANAFDDRSFLFLIKGLVDAIQKKLPANKPVISFMHHPFYFLNDSEHIAPLFEKEQKNNFTKIVEKSNLILAGHVHGSILEPSFLLNQAHMITNGTSFITDNYAGKQHPYTFAIIKVNKPLRKFSMKKFSYRTTAEEGIKKNGFYPDLAEKPVYYHFIEKKKPELTSLEAEKVRVLNYFYDLEEKKDKEQQYRYLVYQLADYREGFNLEEDEKDFLALDAEEDKTMEPGVVKLQSPGGDKVWIYLIDHKDYMNEIRKLLYDNPPAKNVPAGIDIYFSVKRECLQSGDEPDTDNIDKLYRYFQSLVLQGKRKPVSIDLLYH